MTRPLFRAAWRVCLGTWLALALAVATVVALLLAPRNRAA